MEIIKAKARLFEVLLERVILRRCDKGEWLKILSRGRFHRKTAGLHLWGFIFLLMSAWVQTASAVVDKIPFEAESGDLVAPFQSYVSSSGTASNGNYIAAPNGAGSNLTSPGGPGYVSFNFIVPAQDTYQVWARVIAPNGSDDSFFVRIDDGAVQTWWVPQGSAWHWAKVSDTTMGTFNAVLSAGSHTIFFRQREDGTYLDKIILTNDINFVPGPDDISIIGNVVPTVGAVTPASGNIMTDEGQVIRGTYTDANGRTDLQFVYLMIHTTSGNSANCILVRYERATNKLYIRDDSGNNWSSGVTLGSVVVLENSQGKLDCAGTAVSGSGNDMIVDWALTPKYTFMGTKNVYVRAYDNANADSGYQQKGTCVIIEPGTIIGPAGGTVVSPDGKVRLVIPAGALTIDRGIQVMAVDKDDLEGTEPSGTSLLSVVECKPQGLTFLSPVTISYRLDQAEIPGTPVEFGLYDSVQQVIVPIGQTSVVEADGYTVSCTVDHFSVYAALKSLIPQGEPMGGAVKVPLPDMMTGAFGHVLPIKVSPGRKNMQPALGLSYRSSNGPSWVGLGFSLNPGYIVRSTRLGPPTYVDEQDTFYLITDGGTTELVHLIDNLYQAKIESSFNRFYKEADNSWRVVGKTGDILYFGQNDLSREAGFGGTFSWFLTRAQDTNGNYVAYEYVKDEGKAYLSAIAYTGNANIGTLPKNRVEFTLESRPDVISSYISGMKIMTAKRLHEIQAKCNGDLVWRYPLTYTASPKTGRSLLTAFQQCASDGTCLPEQSFSYQE